MQLAPSGDQVPAHPLPAPDQRGALGFNPVFTGAVAATTTRKTHSFMFEDGFNPVSTGAVACDSVDQDLRSPEVHRFNPLFTGAVAATVVGWLFLLIRVEVSTPYS